MVPQRSFISDKQVNKIWNWIKGYGWYEESRIKRNIKNKAKIIHQASAGSYTNSIHNVATPEEPG